MDAIQKSKLRRTLWQRKLFQIATIIAMIGTVFIAVPRAKAVGATIFVTTAANVVGDGGCSFQEAVQATNTNAAYDSCPGGNPTGEIDTIAFGIGGSGTHTITVTTVTQIAAPVRIDGSTQPGYSGIPLIHITGAVEDLLRFAPEADGSTVKALRLTNTSSGGIDRATAIVYSDNNRFIGNYFNTDGTSVVGANGAGLLLDHSSGNVIGGATAADRNLFGGQVGMYVQDSSNNLIQGNYFGVRANGVTALSGLPGNASGIQIFNVVGNSSNNTVQGNVITGFLAGINLTQGASFNTVVGNYIGVGADGNTRLSNGIGVFVYGASSNTIGGATAAARNVISGNSSTNVTLQTINASYQTVGNVIQGNFIGANAAGTGTVSPGATYGVYVLGGTTGNYIKGNVIAGNTDGVYIDGSSAVASGSSQNCFNGNSRFGVNNTNAGATAPFSNNWWGSPSGPKYSGNPGGSGDAISANVAYSPFLTSVPAECSGGSGGGGGGGVGGSGGSGVVGIYRPSNGIWYVKDQFNVQFGGAAGDVPVPGDYNGDGNRDVAIYRPSNGIWYVKDQFNVQFGGAAGDVPVPGDYNGDGKTDIAIYRSSNGIWYVSGQFNVQFGGAAGDIPVPGDYNGDGRTDVAIYRPSNGIWYVMGQFAAQFGGAAGDIPIQADYNGDGRTDVAIYRPSNGIWYVKDQFNVQFGGATGDFPLPARDTNGDGDPYQ